MVAAVALSPRFRLPLNVGREFDLRAEDIVLVGLLGWWALRDRDLSAARSRLLRAFALYLSVGLLSTAVNVLFFHLPALRAAAFWGKSLEFLLIASLFATWARRPSERRLVVASLLGLGFANLAWVIVQMVQRPPFHALLAIRPRGGWPHDSYGPGLIGEISPLSTGSFFLLQFLVWFAWFAVSPRLRAGLRRYAASAAMLLAMILAESRVSYIGSAVGAGSIALLSRRLWKVGVAFAAAFILGNGVLISTGDPDVARVTGVYFIEQSLIYRVQVIWQPLFGKYTGTYKAPAAAPTPPIMIGLNQAPPPPTAQSEKPPAAVQLVIGYGVGAMGSAPGLPVEAHNQFLRVFLETGAVGLLAFLALLVLLLRETYRVFRSATVEVDKILGLATLAAVLAFLLASLLQDMFFPVIPNELLWILVGLVVAVRLSTTVSAQSSTQGFARRAVHATHGFRTAISHSIQVRGRAGESINRARGRP